MRGDDLVVVREIEARRAVERPPVPFDELDELHLSQVLGALEHHMLEKMGEPGASYSFVLGADVIPIVDVHHRQLVVNVQDHLQAVGQRVFLEGDPGK